MLLPNHILPSKPLERKIGRIYQEKHHSNIKKNDNSIKKTHGVFPPRLCSKAQDKDLT